MRATLLTLLTTLCVSCAPALASPRPLGGLPRRATLGFEVEAVGDRLVVDSVEAGTPAHGAGLRPGDRLTRVDGRSYAKPYEGRDLLRRLDGGKAVSLAVVRDGRTRTVKLTPAAEPLETIEGLETRYGAITTPDGARLRTFVSVPSGTSGARPALFFVQWVACGSIEVVPGDPTTDMLVEVARRLRLTLLRVERSSSGDSEGPGCHTLDFDTEVAHYRAAFDALVQDRAVDREEVFVWGNSLGSVVAPFVVRGKRIAGLAVGGGGALPYLERMITFDRIRLERDEIDPRRQHAEMQRRIAFHYQYLVEGRDPEAIEAREPALEGVWGRILGAGDGVHYGRPYAYHRQAAAKNILAAWLDVEAPVLVMYNAFDQFEAEHGHRLIARTLNRRRPGQVTYVRHEQMGHGHRIYPDEYAAHRWAREQRVSGAHVGAQTVIDWIRARREQR